MVVLTNIRQRPRKITTTREQNPRQLDYLIYIYSKKSNPTLDCSCTPNIKCTSDQSLSKFNARRGE